MDKVIVGFTIGAPGPLELMIILGIALLLFGKRLPEVARNLGKGIIEFKKGVRGIEDDVENATYASSVTSRPVPKDEDGDEELTAPKFEPPKFEPSETTEKEEQV